MPIIRYSNTIIGGDVEFATQTSRALDADHAANLDLLARIEQSFVRRPPPGEARDPALPRLVATLGAHLSNEIARHFAFEEQELFPRLADAGDGDLGELLNEEHAAIRTVAAEVLPLTRIAEEGTLDDDGWIVLKRGALELTERLRSHIDKETMALLPALDNLLDDETDRGIAFAYTAG
jgi:hemerythrin-like domain-containing protein